MISDQRIISIAKLVAALRAHGVAVAAIRRVLVEALGLDEQSAAVVVPDPVPMAPAPKAASVPPPAPPPVPEREAQIDALEEALDADPTRLAAFEELSRILTEMADWKRLERAHRKMLVRCTQATGTSVDVLASLWIALGTIYRDRLGHDAPAIECLRIAVRLRPDDAAALAALRALGG